MKGTGGMKGDLSISVVGLGYWGPNLARVFSFGEFQYSYHYGDCHIPRIEQEEPLRRMARHFVDCILDGAVPRTNGIGGLDVVRILEACTTSLHSNGAAVRVARQPVAPVAPLKQVNPVCTPFAC